MSRKKDVRKKWMKQLRPYGLSDKDFDLTKEVLYKKFHKEPSDYDVIWNLFIKITLKTTDLQELKGLYYTKALFLNEEGRDCTIQLQQSAKCELIGFKQSEAIKVKILSAGGCESCQKQDGKIFTIKDALEKMPIPCKDCTFKLRESYKNPFCRCCYVPIFDEESEL